MEQQLRRGESICDLGGAPDGPLLAGTKRKRNEADDAVDTGDCKEEDKQEEPATAQLLKETWMSKRPKLAEAPHEESGYFKASANKEHQLMQQQQQQ
mgnify:FL=1